MASGRYVRGSAVAPVLHYITATRVDSYSAALHVSLLVSPPFRYAPSPSQRLRSPRIEDCEQTKLFSPHLSIHILI